TILRRPTSTLFPYTTLFRSSPKETEAWQNHLLEVADATMRKLPHRQLLAVNYANDYTLVKDPHPVVSVLNFHYSRPTPRGAGLRSEEHTSELQSLTNLVCRL